jgi:glucan biosynthesis protein C
LGLALTRYLGLLWYYHTILSSRTEPLSAIYECIETSLLLAARLEWVLAILDYDHAYLNMPSSVLRYLFRALYPSYLLHQSVLTVAAFY